MKIAFSFSFSDIMDCSSVLSSLSVDSGAVIPGSVKCKNEISQTETNIQAAKWTLEGILDKVPDGVLSMTVGKSAKTVDSRNIEVSCILLIFRWLLNLSLE